MARWPLLALVLVLAALGALPAAAAAQGAVHFTTPSGNIDCIGQGATVDCLVERASWPRVPPKPAGCDTDWFGTEIVLSSGRVRLGSCRGDIGPMCLDPGAPCTRLAYGRSLSVRRGGIRCTSRRTGLTCRARNGGGAGFRVAARGYRIFAAGEP